MYFDDKMQAKGRKNKGTCNPVSIKRSKSMDYGEGRVVAAKLSSRVSTFNISVLLVFPPYVLLARSIFFLPKIPFRLYNLNLSFSHSKVKKK